MTNSLFSRRLPVLLLLLLAACASTTPGGPYRTADTGNAPEIGFPPYEGPRTAIAVFPMGLSQRAAGYYPHLLEKSVGLGVHNMLTDSLYRTGRFRFVEDKNDIILEALKRQQAGVSGIVDQATAVRIGKILGARKIVYGEVFDYAEETTETITGLKTTRSPLVRVGIQIRLVDLETLEYIPSSAIGYGIDWNDGCKRAINKAVAGILAENS